MASEATGKALHAQLNWQRLQPHFLTVPKGLKCHSLLTLPAHTGACNSKVNHVLLYCCSAHWRKNLPVLGTKARVYAIDLLGYGYSDKPNPRYVRTQAGVKCSNW